MTAEFSGADFAADRVRGFPAFGRQPAGGRRFARTWWGKAWIRALEESSLDQGPLRRGRTYARGGHVGPITASPGRLAATVHDPSAGPGDPAYTCVIHLTRLNDEQWTRLTAGIAAKAGHIAALLEREISPGLVETADDADVPLLPDFAELEPACDCPDWELPCTHAAALAYQVSWLLDADPFILLLLRGRGERELLTELQRLNAAPLREDAPDSWPESESSGTSASLAYAEIPRPLPPPMPIPPLSTEAGLALTIPPADGIDPEKLRALAATAAIRAHRILTE